MRKLLSLFVMLCLALPALGQGRNEFNLSIGGVSGDYSLLSADYDSSTDLYGLYEPHYLLSSGGAVMSLDYHFKLNQVVWLGAEADWSTVQGRSYYNIGGQQGQKFSTNVFTVMPQVKLRIPGAAHFRLYGKAAAGVRFVVTDLDAFKKSSPVRFAWDITPIGFEWGGNTVFGMAELCVGNVLMGGRVGVGFRF